MSDKGSFGVDDDEYDRLQDDIERARIEGNRIYGCGSSHKDNSDDKGKNKIEKKSAGYQKEDTISNKQVIAYKYSNRFKTNLHEAIILNGQPIFLTYDRKSDEIKIVKNIQESNCTIKPPAPEEYPYEPYEFKDMNEVISYAQRAKNESIDSLYQKGKQIVTKYNDQDDYKIVIITADAIWSYHQDRFSTTHYDEIIGDNGSGKSTVGDTFEAFGYRPVNMTDPTAANLFRILGTLEPGQCTIVADEAEKIDKYSDIMSILKSGYHIKKKVAKTNTNTWKQEFYWTYCFKMIIGERSLGVMLKEY